MPALLAMLLPYAPLVLKLGLGLLPTNAATVVSKVVETAKAGLDIAVPVIRTLDNISGSAEGADISLTEMQAAVDALHRAGPYEDALAKAKAAS